MKINIAQDDLYAHNLSEHPQGNRYRLSSQWLQFSFEQVEINTVDHFLTNNENFIYQIGTHNGPKYWCISTDGQCNLFDMISQKIKDALKQKQCVLHIDQTMEAFPLYEYETEFNTPRPVNYYKSFHKFCLDNSIDPRQIVYSTSNLQEHNLYSQWCKDNQVQQKMNIVALPFFACATQQRGFFDLIDQPDLRKDPHDVQYVDQIFYKNNNSISVYNCLNRVDRIHRNAFIAMLNYYNLIDNNIVSHNRFSPHIKDFLMMDKWPDHPAFQQKNIHDIKSKLPLVYDMKDFNINYAQNFNKDIYKKTWVSVITETFYQDPNPVVFFSEKIFKPIRAHHPFIIVGHSNSLKWLKKLGFQTFDKWWDESYDKIENPTARMQKICELLSDISRYDSNDWQKIYTQMQSCLENNYNKIIQTDWFTDSYNEVMENI